jgi:hypothetical protein
VQANERQSSDGIGELKMAEVIPWPIKDALKNNYIVE